MQTYTTLDRDVVDISNLSPRERAFLEACREAFEANEDWERFTNRISGPANPVLEPGCRITREVQQNPVWRAVRDMEDRLGIRQEKLRPGPDDDLAEPFDDETIGVGPLAVEKGVSLKAVYKAIDRGDLVTSRENGRLVVSRRSANRWNVSELRQAAGRLRGRSA